MSRTLSDGSGESYCGGVSYFLKARSAMFSHAIALVVEKH